MTHSDLIPIGPEPTPGTDPYPLLRLAASTGPGFGGAYLTTAGIVELRDILCLYDVAIHDWLGGEG